MINLQQSSRAAPSRTPAEEEAWSGGKTQTHTHTQDNWHQLYNGKIVLAYSELWNH